MAEYRRFFADAGCRDGDAVYLAGSEFHHLKKVLRMRQGDEVVVCFNDGMDNVCVIENIGEKEAELRIIESRVNPAENALSITLFQACMKGDKNDFCVQKAVELGVDRIVPFQSAFTVAKFDAKKTGRFERIAFEASKQCGRAKLTKVDDCVAFCDVVQETQNFDTVVFCNEFERENMMLDTLLGLDLQGDIAIVVGSEGGFSDEEQKELKSRQNVVSVSFGSRVLRAETASVFALSLLSGVVNRKNKRGL